VSIMIPSYTIEGETFEHTVSLPPQTYRYLADDTVADLDRFRHGIGLRVVWCEVPVGGLIGLRGDRKRVSSFYHVGTRQFI